MGSPFWIYAWNLWMIRQQKSKGGTPWKPEIKNCPRSMKLAGHQPMVHSISHSEFRQNRSMGTSKTAGWSVRSIFLPDSLKWGMYFFRWANFFMMNPIWSLRMYSRVNCESFSLLSGQTKKLSKFEVRDEFLQVDKIFLRSTLYRVYV